VERKSPRSIEQKYSGAIPVCLKAIDRKSSFGNDPFLTKLNTLARLLHDLGTFAAVEQQSAKLKLWSSLRF
jgi:hypothetical protein